MSVPQPDRETISVAPEARGADDLAPDGPESMTNQTRKCHRANFDARILLRVLSLKRPAQVRDLRRAEIPVTGH